MKIADAGIHKTSDGHFGLPLPFKEDLVHFPCNRDLSASRLDKLKRRLVHDHKYRCDYLSFMEGIIDKGYAEKVPKEEVHLTNGHIWYIPHHGVYNSKKPDKIRVVFYCAASYNAECLNKRLLQGPALTNNLVGVLCRFRQGPVAFVCDIEAMFHQVKVNIEHRNFIRFLWWGDGNIDRSPEDYRMTVHLFGAVSSPGCAKFGLKKTADEYEAEYGSDAANFVRNDFYVDDGLKSVSTTENAISLIERAKSLCQRGGFHLHKFVSNKVEVIEAIAPEQRAKSIKDLDLTHDILPVERALGVEWCVESDTFQFRINLRDRLLTRRGILSTVSSVFDPLGMVLPFVLMGKQILQEMCKDGVDWDETIPDCLRMQWIKWRNDIQLLADLKIPRYYKPEGFEEVKTVELHHFSDASQDGYGQCSYIRLIDVNGSIHCSLAMAKSRVTPLKPVTIPRLELTAALISVKVSSLLKKELMYENVTDIFWTDSKVVLGYIANNVRRFHTFVANRVQQIRDQTMPEQWRYVDTKSNPADDASRGLSSLDLISRTRWWKGPDFLWSLHDESGPAIESIASLSPEDPEVRISVHTAQVQEYATLLERLEYFSDWHRAKRAVAVCLRLQAKFVKKRKLPDAPTSKMKTQEGTSAEKCKYRPVDVQEMHLAEDEIIRNVQKKYFEEEIQVLTSLKTFENEDRRDVVKCRTQPD